MTELMHTHKHPEGRYAWWSLRSINGAESRKKPAPDTNADDLGPGACACACACSSSSYVAAALARSRRAQYTKCCMQNIRMNVLNLNPVARATTAGGPATRWHSLLPRLAVVFAAPHAWTQKLKLSLQAIHQSVSANCTYVKHERGYPTTNIPICVSRLMGLQAARLVTTWVLRVQDVCRTVFVCCTCVRSTSTMSTTGSRFRFSRNERYACLAPPACARFGVRGVSTVQRF